MFRLTIETRNAAFSDDDGEAAPAAMGAEIARILRLVAEHLDGEYTSGRCFDVNGNRVGAYTLTKEA